MNEEVTFTPQHTIDTAVLFLVFNRLDNTKLVFEAIRQAKPPRLYVAADGARVNKEGEAKIVQAVRDYILQNINWECQVKTLFRDQNLGCKYAVSGAITWFFENEEQGIILEDDCVPNFSFFIFCQSLLEKYRFDSRVGMISGTKLGFANFEGHSHYSFSRLVQIWGWATWRRAWEGYDVEIKSWIDFKEKKGLQNIGLSPHICRYLENVFESAFLSKIDTWDYQWSYKCISEGLLTIFPRNNLVLNIGFGPNATHTTQLDGASLPLEDLEMLDQFITHPRFTIPNKSYDDSKILKKSKFRIIINFVLRKCISFFNK